MPIPLDDLLLPKASGMIALRLADGSGRMYVLDTSPDLAVGWLFTSRLREVTATADVADERAISLEGAWRRSRDTWLQGEGQEWADRQDSSAAKAHQLVGWLPNGENFLSPTGNPVRNTGPDSIITSRGPQLLPHPGPAGFIIFSYNRIAYTPVNGGGWTYTDKPVYVGVATPEGFLDRYNVATNGLRYWWYGEDANGKAIWCCDVGSESSAFRLSNAVNANLSLFWANDRLVVQQHNLTTPTSYSWHDATSIANATSAQPIPSSFYQVRGYGAGVAGGKNGVYIAWASLSRTMFIVLSKPSSTGQLQAPVIVDQQDFCLPVSIAAAEGFVVVNFLDERGQYSTRFYKEVGADSLVAGPVHRNTGRIDKFAVVGNVMVGVPDTVGQAESPHVIAWDLAALASDAEPAKFRVCLPYNPGATGADAINRWFHVSPYWTTNSSGIVLCGSNKENTNEVARVYWLNWITSRSVDTTSRNTDSVLETGWFTWGTSTSKKLLGPVTVVRSPAMSQDVPEVYVDVDDGAGWRRMYDTRANTSADKPEVVAMPPAGVDKPVYRARYRVVLPSNVASQSFRLWGFTAEAYVVPPRYRRFVYALRISPRVADPLGRMWELDPFDELLFLRKLCHDATPVRLYTADMTTEYEGAMPPTVFVDSVEWRPMYGYDDGIAVVTLQAVEENVDDH